VDIVLEMVTLRPLTKTALLYIFLKAPGSRYTIAKKLKG
jgi:hypothetical protein